jgi:hypothetical protein
VLSSLLSILSLTNFQFLLGLSLFFCSRQVVASTIAAAAGLNFEDVFSLLIYSFEIGGDRREENVYFRLNKILKERNNLTELLRWRNYLYFLLRAVRKLPNTGPCRVYRAIDVKVGREKYDSGDEVVWNTFTR